MKNWTLQRSNFLFLKQDVTGTYEPRGMHPKPFFAKILDKAEIVAWSLNICPVSQMCNGMFWTQIPFLINSAILKRPIPGRSTHKPIPFHNCPVHPNAAVWVHFFTAHSYYRYDVLLKPENSPH